jgi:hypothetical protein
MDGGVFSVWGIAGFLQANSAMNGTIYKICFFMLIIS